MRLTTRGLHLSSTIFIMICESKRGRVAQPAAWLHLTYRADQAADDHRSPALYARLRNQYSLGIMSVPVGEPPTIASTLTLYPVLAAVTKSRACSLKEERGSPDATRCNELRRPVKLLPLAAHSPYCGSSSVVENHFEGVSDGVGFKERQL